MTKFDRIKEFYAEMEDAILAAPRNEYPFGFAPWCWDGVIEMTPIELWLWEEICNAQAIFYPQYPVGRRFVDFGNPGAKLAVECDGAAYHQNKEKDEARDAELKALGWDVIRITGSECARESDPESGQPSYARVFIEALAARYGIKRKGAWYLPEIRTPEWRDWMGQELPERVAA